MSEAMTPDAASPKQPDKEKRYVLSGEEAFAVRRWWQRLTLGPEALIAFTQQPAWPRGVRARLRRCESPEAAMLTEGFRHLWHMLPQPEDETSVRRETRLQVWASVALVLAELRDETPGASLGGQLGKEKKSTGKPFMSELRFQQLMNCQTPEELVRRLRRALALVDRQDVSAVQLTDNIVQWWHEHQGRMAVRPAQRLGFQWANDYFSAQSRYARDE